MNEKTAYQWSLECVKPISGLIESHKAEQVIDKVASAILQADREARSECHSELAALRAINAQLAEERASLSKQLDALRIRCAELDAIIESVKYAVDTE